MESSWTLFDSEIQKYSLDHGELDFPLDGQAKERARNHRTPQKTRNYEAVIAELAREQIDRKPLVSDPKAQLSIDVLWLCQKKNGDLSNLLKALEDGLNLIAWHDDKQIYHVNALVLPGQPKDHTLMRIRERES
jgi:Holliday junction resolvase RusA-like endonuclease